MHATPRTITSGDVALYTGLYASRFAVQSSDAFAKAIGYPRAPVDDLIVFHVVFGKTVPDISLNAVANLGYAECRFLAPVFAGDTLTAVSEVIGLKENSNRETGVVYVRSKGVNQHGVTVLDYVRWVMVRKADTTRPAPEPIVPKLPAALAPDALGGAVPLLDPLDEETLVRILSEPRNAILKQYAKFFDLDGVELIVEPAALGEVAREALKRKTGARALRAIIEQVMMDVMYEVPSSDEVKRVVIPKGIIDDQTEPILMTEEDIRKAS